MNNEEIKLEYMHLCDYASPALNGKINLLGVFESFFITKAPDFYVVLKFNVKVKGEYKVSFEIQTEKGDLKIFVDDKPLTIQSDSPALRFQILKPIKNIDFKNYGNYKLLVKVNDFIIGEKLLEVKPKLTKPEVKR